MPCIVVGRPGLKGAAIIIINDKLRVIEAALYTSYFKATAEIELECGGALTVVSAYFKYAIPTVQFLPGLRDVIMGRSHLVIGVDTNGHSAT